MLYTMLRAILAPRWPKLMCVDAGLCRICAGRSRFSCARHVYRKYVVRMAPCGGPDRQSHRAQVSVRSMNARYADRNSITCMWQYVPFTTC
jgi:hypothetical protein